MKKLKKIIVIILIINILLSNNSSAIINSSSPYTITATIYNKESTEYGITFRSDELYEKPQIQVIMKSKNPDFTKSRVYNAEVDNYDSYELDYIYKGVISGLLYDTEYLYRVGNSEDNNWSNICSFRTAPSQFSSKPFTFLFTPDTQGSSKRWGEVLKQAFFIYPDARFILHTGDMVDNGLSESEWKNMLWDNRLYTTKTLINSISGNYHEDRGSELYNHFNKKLPANQSVEKGYFYSFDYSNAHFLMLDVTDINNDFTFSDLQLNWMKNDLAKTKKRWRIVALHWSIYSTGPHSNYDIDKLNSLRKQVEPLFDKYDVDIVLQGHDHVYTRSKSILNGNVVTKNKTFEKEYNGQKYISCYNQKGTTYLTGGSSGTKFYGYNVPDRFYNFFEVNNAFKKSVFTAITITENDLIVSSYIYDEKNDTVTLHDRFGFTRTYTRHELFNTLLYTISIMTLLRQIVFRKYFKFSNYVNKSIN